MKSLTYIRATLFLAVMLVITSCGPAATPEPAATPAEATPAPTAAETAEETEAETTSAVSDDTVRVALRQMTEYRRLDPHDAQGSVMGIWENMYEALVGVDNATLERYPLLAESWEVYDGGARYVFKLRKGIKFHDGTDLTSEDVKLSFERVLALKKTFFWQRLERIEEIRTPDDYTIEFIMQPGGTPFPADAAAVRIVSADAVREHEVDGDLANAWFSDNVDGTGPYKMQEWKVNERAVMVRNEDYWGVLPYFKTAIILQIPEDTTTAMMLQEGEIDVATGIPPDMLDELKANPELRVVEQEGIYQMCLRLLCQGDVPTADPHVRRAIAYAMNYPLLWSVRAEDFLPTDGPVPAPFLGGWVPTESLYEYDLEKAREELAQSEYPDGGFTIRVAFPKGDAHYQAALEILQSELKKLNIELDVQAREWTTVFTQFQEWKKENDDDAVRDMHGLTLGLPALAVDVSNYVGVYHSDSDINFCAYSNPDVDALLDEAETTTDMDHRDELYKEAVELILQDSPDIYLGLDKMIEVVGADIEGFQIPIIWHPWGVDLDKLSRSQ